MRSNEVFQIVYIELTWPQLQKHELGSAADMLFMSLADVLLIVLDNACPQKIGGQAACCFQAKAACKRREEEESYIGHAVQGPKPHEVVCGPRRFSWNVSRQCTVHCGR